MIGISSKDTLQVQIYLLYFHMLKVTMVHAGVYLI